MSAMNAFDAHVRNGHIVVDEPTDLPEGTKLRLQVVEAPESLDDEARAELNSKLREGLNAARAGRTVSAEALKSKLLSRP
jgi:hypothetical protein